MRVLFVHPFFLTESRLERRLMTPYPPLGLLGLAAVARDAGHTVEVFDGTFSRPAGLESVARSFRPDVMCLGSLVTWRSSTLALGELARESGTPVVVGGPDPTATPDAYLPPGGPADAVVLGEGEATLLDLLEALANGAALLEVPGLALRREDTTVRTARRVPIEDLDALPMPARDLVDVDRYLAAWRRAHGYSSLTIAVGRGCPTGCAHCRAGTPGTHFRLRQPAAVAAEMSELEQRYGPDRFRIVDDLEGLDRAWLRELGRAMSAAGVSTLYEGLRPYDLGAMPGYAAGVDVCAERNRWIPPSGRHGPPALDAEEVRRRWATMALPPGESLADP